MFLTPNTKVTIQQGRGAVMAERTRTETRAAPLLLDTISLKQSHIVLQDVDGSEVSITLDDTIDLYQFVKDHLQEIEERRVANWQAYLATVDG